VLTGDRPGSPLDDVVPRISGELLLISADVGEERDFNALYERAAREPAEHWNLPRARHTGGLRRHPEQYERRVVGFFARSLRGSQPPRPTAAALGRRR
jgi:hypothetical protein